MIFAYMIAPTVGIVLLVLGVKIAKGNIDLLHSYHRNNVSDEDMHAFGRMMGMGIILFGLGIVLFGILSIVTELTKQKLYMTIGDFLMVIGIVSGIVLMVYAGRKYNRSGK